MNVKIFAKSGLVFFLLFFCIISGVKGQDRDSIRIMFWNLENLFDTEDDSLINDDEFLPGSIRNWNYSKYHSKINKIWKVIVSTGNPDPPEIIAFAEVENRKVLEDLIKFSPFGSYGYRIIHRNSPDKRGIDVAVVYDPDKLSVDSIGTIKNKLPNKYRPETRDILYIRFKCNNSNLNLFVNHWPSKYGGAAITESLRIHSARLLKSICEDKLDENVVCTGDFNDSENSKSICCLTGDSTLIRLGNQSEYAGTIKYQGFWETIDHFFVSRILLNPENDIGTKGKMPMVYAPGYLIEKDKSYGGLKPYRTWTGFQYNGGVSDHLPIILTLYIRMKL